MSEHKKHNDGGPAFPRPSYGPNEPADGMSLRDWFAGQVLAGMNLSEMEAGRAAVWAYEAADAMIATREEKQ